MLFAVLFEDDPARADARDRHMAAHLAFLEDHADQVRGAGPLLDTGDGDGNPAGGLWLVEADAESAVRDLVESDPFWPTGLRRSVRILHWRRVFPEGSRRR